MRYAVTYLTSGERQADQVEAPDAATAVAVVQGTRGHSPRAFDFELLSVLRVDDQLTSQTLRNVRRAPTA